MKTIDEIYSEMLTIFTERTGLDAGAGGDLAVRFYAVAAQIHALYLQAAWTEKQCFPQTATGEYLDYHAELRGVERKGAAAASGVLRFSVGTVATADLTVPAGTVCMTAGLVRFETTAEGVLAAGKTYVDVPAVAVETGEAGNVAAGTILTMSVAPAGVAACTNPAPFSGGADDEDDDSLRARVLETYRRLANGANAAFYHQKAMSFEEVAAATVEPRARGVGTVDVVIATAGGIPEASLLDEVQEYFDSVREIAVDVQVLAPVLQSMDVSVAVKVAENCDSESVLEKVRNVLSGWFSGERLGQAVLLAELGAAVFAVDGVENYAFSEPAADIDIDGGTLPSLGTLKVEEMA